MAAFLERLSASPTDFAEGLEIKINVHLNVYHFWPYSLMGASGATPKVFATPDSFGVVNLRRLVEERFPKSHVSTPGYFCSGVSRLDQAIGGGLPKSAITELITPQTSAGSASLLQGLIQSGQRHGYFLALIDGRDSFDPGPLGNESLRCLLWVRCRQALEAIKAADLLLRDGNFPLVMVDLVLNSLAELRKIPQTTWYRLQRLVEASPTACLVLSQQSMVASAQLKIVLENSWTLESLKDEEACSRLRFRIQRSHVSAIRGQKSEVSQAS